MSTHEIATESFDGVTYYSAIACDGWPTGPCATADKAIERAAAYERGEEVSEAAPGQASRAQMQAFRSWVEVQRFRDGGGIARTVDAAIEAGLHTAEWLRSSTLLRNLAGSADQVIHAGGAYIRRRMPQTRIPTRGAS
jgi:hypothetical protein